MESSFLRQMWRPIAISLQDQVQIHGFRDGSSNPLFVGFSWALKEAQFPTKNVL